jgi:hypothetical protein
MHRFYKTQRLKAPAPKGCLKIAKQTANSQMRFDGMNQATLLDDAELQPNRAGRVQSWDAWLGVQQPVVEQPERRGEQADKFYVA